MENIYTQNICQDCLQMLVNGESDHDASELEKFNKTLDKWAKEKYFPAGLHEDTEPSFSWHECDLCNGLAGDRYLYYFRDESRSKTTQS